MSSNWYITQIDPVCKSYSLEYIVQIEDKSHTEELFMFLIQLIKNNVLKVSVKIFLCGDFSCYFMCCYIDTHRQNSLIQNFPVLVFNTVLCDLSTCVCGNHMYGEISHYFVLHNVVLYHINELIYIW